MEKRYLVSLTAEERLGLEQRFVGSLTLRQRNRIQVLLKSDSGLTDAEIADDLDVCETTVANLRRRYAAEGLEAALAEKPRAGAPAKLDGKAEAVLIGLACSKAPEGRSTWTAGLLANRIVELRIVESVSEDTVLRMLKKTCSSRGRRSPGVCPRA